jgi:hypothetical protein
LPFQTSVGLEPTGVVDGNTMNALQASLGTFTDLFGSSVIAATTVDEPRPLLRPDRWSLE